MKVLLDEDVPHDLRLPLIGHDVYTTSHMGWARLKNGALLEKAEQNGFQVFVTADQNILFQQNYGQRSFGLVVLSSNRWPQVVPKIAAIADAVSRSTPGTLIRVEL